MTATHTLLTLDTLVSGTHFWPDADPEDIGYKAAMVNLSDIAAMGGEPHRLRIVLSHPTLEASWVEAVHAGLCDAMADAAIGSDLDTEDGDPDGADIEYLSRQLGPTVISVEAEGRVAAGAAMRRSGGRAGDSLFVSGTLGDARYALGLREIAHPGPDQRHCLDKLNRPLARTALGARLCGLATACIDVSDGLASDLAHICAASGLDAKVSIDDVPISSALRTLCGDAQARQLAVTGGDDYELLFTAPPEQHSGIRSISIELGIPITRIGCLAVKAIDAADPDRRPSITFLSEDGSAVPISPGFTHFTG
jgi:thiamine-monophosphate kinase